nr:DUF3631 domain-containing protein [Micromonospora sp. DSM 115978]
VPPAERLGAQLAALPVAGRAARALEVGRWCGYTNRTDTPVYKAVVGTAKAVGLRDFDAAGAEGRDERDREIRQERQRVLAEASDAESRVELEPPEDGSVLLDEVSDMVARFVIFPDEHARNASVLWAVHTHTFDCFESTPRLAIHSPEKQCGKTRLMEVLELLAARKLRTVNATPSAIFRKIDQEPPTLFLDEADTIFGRDAPPESEALRGLLNAGHRPGNPVLRTVGEGAGMEVKEFQTFCPCAIAGIGIADLAQLATVIDRSVVVRLRRRAPGEVVQPFRVRRDEPPLVALGRRLALWADRHRDVFAEAIPDMPDGIEDRPADVWE